MTAVFEIVRFRVDADRAERFVGERASADRALAAFAGFLGSELAQIDAEHWVLVVRWASAAEAAAAQRITLSAASPPALAAWIALAAEVVSFETATLRHTGGAPAPTHSNR